MKERQNENSQLISHVIYFHSEQLVLGNPPYGLDFFVLDSVPMNTFVESSFSINILKH